MTTLNRARNRRKLERRWERIDHRQKSACVCGLGKAYEGTNLMATVIGEDNSAKERFTCKGSKTDPGCGAIVEYVRSDIKRYSGKDYSGGSDGREWVECPRCGNDFTLRSW